MVFQLSHVGDNADAEQFVHSLSVDPELEGMVYCNLKKLDEQLASGSSATKNRSVCCTLTWEAVREGWGCKGVYWRCCRG